MSVRVIWLLVLFESHTFSVICYLLVLAITEIRWIPPTITADWSFLSFSSTRFHISSCILKLCCWVNSYFGFVCPHGELTAL